MKDILVNHVYSSGFVRSIIGITIYHKKLDVSVECTKYKSEHRNRQNCIEQLEKLLAEPKQLELVEHTSDYLLEQAFDEGFRAAGCRPTNSDHYKDLRASKLRKLK